MSDGIKLNKEQLQAVKHEKGPLLIIAGAGTGKTTVITERIKYLIEKDLAKPKEILALTFTDKAAREMEERVDVAMPYGYTQMWISTFHSFCDRILRREALHIGLDPKFRLMTQAETTQFIRDNLFKFRLSYFRPLGNPTKFVSGMLQHFSRLQDEDVNPSDYLKWAEKQEKKKTKSKEQKIETEKWLELAKAFKTYDELKTRESVMDFGDLIVKTLKLFCDRSNVLKEYKDQFKYILVDEFQDTNYAQNELAILLAGKGRNANITVTGDDDQSIYRFRGAAVSNIIQFRKTYTNTKVVVLTKNYRSAQHILDKAYDLIQHNNPDRLEVVEKVDKKLFAQKREDKGQISFFHEDRVENEAERVANSILSVVKKGYEFKDFAILVRANSHADAFIRALQRHSIPFQFLGPGRLFKQSEVIDLVSYLKVLYDFDDSVSMYRLLTIDEFGIPGKDLIRLTNYAKRYNLSLFEACEKISDVYVSDKTKDFVKRIIKTLKRHFSLVKKETAGQLLYYFLEEMDLLQKLLNPDTTEAEKKAANISKFFDKLKTYEVNHENATVPAVVDWIDLSAELGESPLAADTDWTEINAVNILTVHSSKGLEFPIVFLVNLVSLRFPTVERREQIPIPEALIKEVLPTGDYHVQEERRLFYVGVTRAQDRLYLTAANYYGEAKREKKLSPFIFEALGEDALAAEHLKDSGEQLSFLDYQPSKKPATTITGKPLHIDYLSYSQIQTFKICPLHYKLKYIIKIPTPPTAALSFGTSMHAVMKDFYEQVENGKKPIKNLLTSLLKDNWINEGYKSKSHEKQMFEKGVRYLTKYLESELDKKVLPVSLEEPFVVPLEAKKGERGLKIGGKIDRVDIMPDGRIEIVDYKTGERVPDQRYADKDLQLTLYALAANKLKEAPFNKKPEDIVLSLYYFEEGKRISTKRTQKELIDAEREIYEIREKMEESDFSCSGHIFCKSCEYSMFCQADS
jgi:DNA helicase-2/ATP-dependent DNA helicase PcrA